MASDYGTLQWYQSRRSSAAHQKIEKEIEMATTGSDFLPLCRNDKSPKTFDEKLSLALKRIDELIARNKKSSQKMIADDFSPRNPVSTDPQKIGCEEALIEESSMSTNGDESQQFVESGAVLDSQVSLQTKNSNSYKKYTHYSAVELDHRRERGLCLWCDEFWYIGHDCCKNKKFYVFDIDVDDAFEVNKNDPIESRVDVTFVDENESHCKKKLMKDCIENESNVLYKITCDVETENRESSEVLGKHYAEEKNELQVFDELPKQYLSQNIAERWKSYSLENMPEECEINFKDDDNKRLGILNDVEPWYLVVSTTTKVMCLDDVCSGEWMAILITNLSSKDVGSLHKLHEMLEAQSWVVEWIELPLPPPEPPPGLSYTVFTKENKQENLE